jgi:Flp pilus assembly protein TadG
MSHKQISERGQALILIVFGVVALIGITGLAVDGGMALNNRREAQNAADAAALAAAQALIRGENIVHAALGMAQINGFDNNGESNTVEVFNPPVEGAYTGNHEYIQVRIQSKVNTTFGAVVGTEQITNVTDAVARAKPPTLENMFFGNAMVSLNPHDNGAFRSHGNNDTVIQGSGIFVNSDAGCAFEQVGNSTIVAPGGLNVVGGACLHGSISPADAINPGVQQLEYPPTNLPPEPTCPYDSVRIDDTLYPGAWSGTFPPSGVTHLEPGIYCVDGSFKMNAHDTISGDDVTIFMNSGDLHWNGGATIDLTAPTSGPYAGLLIYFPMDNSDGLILNGNSDTRLVGTILAPASDVQINGTSDNDSYHSQVIGYTIDLIGTADLSVNFDSEENHKVYVPPIIEVAK